MTRRLLVLGAGGHGRVVADAARAAGDWDEIAFLDSRYPELTDTAVGPVIGADSAAAGCVAEGWSFVAAIADAGTRRRLVEGLAGASPPATIIHPGAAIGADVEIGPGAMILAQSAINTGARLGASVIVNTGATVDHDCRIGDYAHICPGVHLAGNVTIGSGSWIGIGAAVRQGLSIGSDVTVGAGAAVVAPLASGVTAMGVPATVTARGGPKSGKGN